MARNDIDQRNSQRQERNTGDSHSRSSGEQKLRQVSRRKRQSVAATDGKRAGCAAAIIDLGDFSSASGIRFAGGHRIDPAQHSAQSSQVVRRFAARRLAGQPLVLRMAARLSECQWIDQISAVGCSLPSSVMGMRSPLVETLNLPTCHLVERLGAIVDRTQSEWIVYVPANRPFIDAGLVDSLVSKAARIDECDYIGYSSETAGPDYVEHLGLGAEVCHADTIRRLRRNADRLPPCSTIAQCLEASPGDYNKTFVPIPETLDCAGLRFAIEDEKDWDDAQLLCESVDEIDAEWQQVARLVMSNDSLRSSMESRVASST